MSGLRNLVTIASVLAISGSALGQTRVGMPRPNAGRILSEQMQAMQPPPPQADSGAVRGSRADARRARPTGRVFHVDGRRGDRDRVRGVVSSGSGISISGSHRGDDHSIGFRIGSGRHGHRHDRHGGFKHDSPHHHTLFPWLWSPYRGYYDSGRGYGYDTPTVIVVENPPAGAVRTNELDGPIYVEPPAPPTTEEIAAAAMARGDYEEAVKRWRDRLAEAPDDAEAVRALGLAMALTGEMRSGTAMVAYAYQMSAELVNKPANPALFGNERQLRQALRRAVIYANAERTDSAWVTVATLMQAEGRNDHAARMIEKAREAGLDAELADTFEAALE